MLSVKFAMVHDSSSGGAADAYRPSLRQFAHRKELKLGPTAHVVKARVAQQFELVHAPLDQAVARFAVAAEQRLIAIARMTGKLDEPPRNASQPACHVTRIANPARIGNAGQPI